MRSEHIQIVSEDVQNVFKAISKEEFAGEDILVTGGAGFIGSYLCETLVSCGSKVTCVDNFSTGILENLATIINSKNFKLAKEDVLRFKDSRRYKYIFHLASRAAPEEYQLHPIETLMVNAEGSHRILEIARRDDATVLFTSSSEIYGKAQLVPTPETYWGNVNPIGVRACYDEGKRYGEALFMAYYRQYGLDVKIVRLHNTYGPRLRADGVYARAVSRFISQALKGKDITVYGDGTQTRSFCYISDTLKALIKMMVKKKTKGEVINVGSPMETPIIELARKIRELTHSTSRIAFQPLPQDDPERRCPNISNAKSILDWMPEVNLEEGLRRTIEWFKAS